MSTSTTSRRGFLQTSLAAGAMIAGGALPTMLARSAFAMQDKAAKPLKIVILGGTAFIGPALIDIARKRIALTRRLDDEVPATRASPALQPAERGDARRDASPRTRDQRPTRDGGPATSPANNALAAAFAKARGD